MTGTWRAVNARWRRQNPARLPYSKNDSMMRLRAPNKGWVYYDSTGAVTTNPLQVARISFVARGQSASMLNLTGAGATAFHDSLRIEVGLRNRK